jgi:hypothetical protein
VTATDIDTAADPDAPALMKDPFLAATVWTIDPVLKRIADALVALGGTSAAVGRRLALMRCKGERGNPFYCPVVSYLRRQRVGHFGLLLHSGGWLEVQARDGWVETIRLPLAVEIFQKRFDRGEFPNCAADGSGPGDGFPRPDWKAMSDAEGGSPL